MKRILSILLIVILSLPSIFGLNHFLNEDHVFCNEQGIHFHEYEIECSTCDFIRLNSNYNSNSFEYLDNQFSFSHKLIFFYNDEYFSSLINYFESRGPPTNC